MSNLPEYEQASLDMVERGRLAESFARQVELTTQPYLDIPFDQCQLIDIGCGYGYTAAELAKKCTRVVGLEPNPDLAEHARELSAQDGTSKFELREGLIGDLHDVGIFDVAVMDNVLEHIEDQSEALWRLSRCLRPGGVAFILVPNKLWPIEVHYKLPFLSYLPLPLANRYLRLTGRGRDYRDASYAPSYFRLLRLLKQRPELGSQLTLPADISLADGGKRAGYKFGVAALRRFPQLWMISKAFLVIATKRANLE
jgi:SAM-dependent methyltransferase